MRTQCKHPNSLVVEWLVKLGDCKEREGRRGREEGREKEKKGEGERREE